MSKNEKSGVGKFVLGAAIGAGLGVLFAPKKGSTTRKELKEKLDEFIDELKQVDVKEVKAEFDKKVMEIKEEMADLDKEKVVEIAKEKGEVLKKKAQELVDMAIDKGTPVLRDAAEEVRKKAIVVTKEVLKKLEKK